jgi:hypothetical protein
MSSGSSPLIAHELLQGFLAPEPAVPSRLERLLPSSGTLPGLGRLGGRQPLARSLVSGLRSCGQVIFINNPLSGLLLLLAMTLQSFWASGFTLLGIVAAQRLRDLRRAGPFLIGFAVLAPLLHAGVGLGISRLLGLSQGDSLLFMVLCASASYIAVPAAMRMTVPQANPSLYISSALGVTFPFNVVVGIPLYMALIQRFVPLS